jgi:hypothetical protein
MEIGIKSFQIKDWHEIKQGHLFRATHPLDTLDWSSRDIEGLSTEERRLYWASSFHSEFLCVFYFYKFIGKPTISLQFQTRSSGSGTWPWPVPLPPCGVLLTTQVEGRQHPRQGSTTRMLCRLGFFSWLAPSPTLPFGRFTSITTVSQTY